MSLFSLKGRVALVTGAGRGIGRGIAEGLAANGAKVVCAARTRSQIDNAVTAIQKAGGEALACKMDMEDLASIQSGVDAAIQAYGQIDILVNNAGINIREPFVDVTEEHYDSITAINQKGVFFLTQAVVRNMIPNRSGKIIHIGSLSTGISLPQISVYTATKGAVGQLTKSNAIELGEHNIQVNAICPGFIMTPLTEKIWADPKLRDWGLSRIAANRLGSPEDLVGTAIFLSSAASDYVTGQSIYVDGGFMAGDLWPLPE